MNCQEFLARLDAHDALDLPTDLEGHAQDCPACRARLAAARRMGEGLAVLRGAVRVPDLALRIRQAAARNPASAGSSVSWGEWLMDWWMWLAPTTPFKSTVFYGASAAIIFALCWTIVARVPPNRQEMAPPAMAWTLAMERGSWPEGVAVLPGTDRASVALGQRLAFPAGAQGRLVWPGRAVVSQLDGRVVPLADGVRLEAGTARLDVEPKPAGAPPFQVETPFARITVVGTSFRLLVTASRLDVEVMAGRVRVQAGVHDRTLGPGESVAVDARGEIAGPAVAAPSEVNSQSDRPEVPQD